MHSAILVQIAVKKDNVLLILSTKKIFALLPMIWFLGCSVKLFAYETRTFNGSYLLRVVIFKKYNNN